MPKKFYEIDPWFTLAKFTAMSSAKVPATVVKAILASIPWVLQQDIYCLCLLLQGVKTCTALTTAICIFVESNAVNYASVNNSLMPIEFSFTILRCH